MTDLNKHFLGSLVVTVTFNQAPKQDLTMIVLSETTGMLF